MKILITLCTYNEHDNVRDLIPEILTCVPTATVLVIDDQSPDGTGQLVRELSERDQRIRLVSRSGKLGLGTATLAGFRYAIEHKFDLLVNLDADFSHNPKYIPKLLAEMDEFDIAIGSRYVVGGEITGWTRTRKLMSRLINLWARLMLNLTTADNSGSFRCYRVARLAEIDWDLTLAKGYAFQEEILYRFHGTDCRMTEIPILFEDRRYGLTKINMRESLAAVFVILRLGLRNLLRRQNRRGNPA